MGIWNNIGGLIDSLVDPDEEARKRAAFLSPNGQNPGEAAAPQSTVEPDTQTATSNAMAPSSGARRMFALQPGSGVQQPDTGGNPATPPYPMPDAWKAGLSAQPAMLPPDQRAAADPNDVGLQRPDNGTSSRPRIVSGIDAAPPKTAQPMSAVQRDAAAIQAAKNTNPDVDAARKKGWLKRFGSGALNSWRNFDGRGGLIGLGADVLDKGITDAVSPKSYAEEVKQRGLQKQWNNLAQDQALGEAQRKDTIGNVDQIKKINDLNEARMKPYIAEASKKGYLTQEEVDHVKANGVDITNPNNPDFVEKDENGKHYIRRKNEPNYVPNPTLPQDIEKTPHDTTLTVGGKDVTLPLTPPQALQGMVSAADRAAKAAAAVQKREDDQANKDYTDTKDYQKDMRAWQKDSLKYRGQKSKAISALGSDDPTNPTGLYKSRKELIDQGFSTAEIDKQIADHKGAIAEAQVWIDAEEKTKPQRTVRKTATPSAQPSPKGGKNKAVGTNDDYNKALKQLKGQ